MASGQNCPGRERGRGGSQRQPVHPTGITRPSECGVRAWSTTHVHSRGQCQRMTALCLSSSHHALHHRWIPSRVSRPTNRPESQEQSHNEGGDITMLATNSTQRGSALPHTLGGLHFVMCWQLARMDKPNQGLQRRDIMLLGSRQYLIACRGSVMMATPIALWGEPTAVW